MSSKHCRVFSAAMEKKSSVLSEQDIAAKLQTSEQHVRDIIAGKTKPTPDEFRALANALDISVPLPNDTAHTA